MVDIDIDVISDYVLKFECFVWVVLKDLMFEEIDLMGEEFGLYELVFEDVCKGY